MRGTVYFRFLMTHLGFLETVYFQREDRIFYAGGTVYFQHLRTLYFSRPYILSRGPYIFSRQDRIFSAWTVYFTGDPSQLSKFIQTFQLQPELSNCSETFQLQRNFPTKNKTFQLRSVLSNFARFFPTSIGSFQLRSVLSNFARLFPTSA